MSSCRGVFALPVLGVGAEARAVFGELACVQCTTLPHPANSQFTWEDDKEENDILWFGYHTKRADVFEGNIQE